MKLFYTSVLAVLVSISGIFVSHAASFIVKAPETTSSNGEVFSVMVYIDPAGDTLSGIAGDLVFPNDLFTLVGVSVRSSIISLWTAQPTFSNVVTTGALSRVHFEGIIPGGFSGLKSAYYPGRNPGLVCSITLSPKKQGTASVVLSGAEVHSFDKVGTMLSTAPVTHTISVPAQTMSYGYVSPLPEKMVSPTLAVAIDRDPLIASNRWYVGIVEDESIRPIEHIFVAESGLYDIANVSSGDFKETGNLYVLKDQSRSSYVHVKVLYENGQYSFVTLRPVENSYAKRYLSRILGTIVFALLALYVFTRTRSHAHKKHH